MPLIFKGLVLCVIKMRRSQNTDSLVSGPNRLRVKAPYEGQEGSVGLGR
jgi:hypothetical protein